jgi:hypothetical protein|nr:MAG TPA: hypothetical protein [Caudoviricetes sp.]
MPDPSSVLTANVIEGFHNSCVFPVLYVYIAYAILIAAGLVNSLSTLSIVAVFNNALSVHSNLSLLNLNNSTLSLSGTGNVY